jgi:hypothetical protein
MRSLLIGAVAALSLLSVPALAETAAKVGAVVKTSDGKRVGRIYAIDGGQTAVILKDGKSIKIAVSTLSGAGNSLTTSLSAADLAKK